MMKKTWKELKEEFNNSAEAKAIIDAFDREGYLQGVVLSRDHVTNEPVCVLHFTQGSKPDLTKLPDHKVAGFVFKTEFAPPARLY